MPLTLPNSKLDNISYCRYISDRSVRSKSHWDARAIVRAIKGDAFGGYADLQIDGAWRRLDQSHAELALQWFVERVYKETSFDPKTKYILVPIPHSSCTVQCGESPKVLTLAKALQQRLPQLQVADILRFKQVMPKTSETNMRDENILYEATLLLQKPPVGNLILLDDVCTTGAHAKAAARAIRGNGGYVGCAMSVARTTLNPTDTVFGFKKEPL